MKLTKFAKYAWGVLAYNLIVILWGAYVRATGSGAGCGSHWPLCNGEVIPRAPQMDTIVEFTHRLSSGLALIMVGILVVWAFRIYRKGHIVRTGAVLSAVFILTEALVGAGLVLFEWVAYDASTGRVISIAIHLVNTFLLLASLTLCAWWASGGAALHLDWRNFLLWVFIIGFLGVIMIGITGAVTALGDTLFPVDSLEEGLRQDLSAGAHYLVRIRVWHPIMAILVGFYLLFVGGLVYMFQERLEIKRFALLMMGLFLIQLLAGLVNLILLAPVWMQLVHLLFADLVWIALVLLSASIFAVVDDQDQKALEVEGSLAVSTG